LGSNKGYRFFGERKSLKRRLEAVEVFEGSARAEDKSEKVYRSSERNKALKGENPRALGAERGLQECGS
jgi:hypothetical protein